MDSLSSCPQPTSTILLDENVVNTAGDRISKLPRHELKVTTIDNDSCCLSCQSINAGTLGEILSTLEILPVELFTKLRSGQRNPEKVLPVRRSRCKFQSEGRICRHNGSSGKGDKKAKLFHPKCPRRVDESNFS